MPPDSPAAAGGADAPADGPISHDDLVAEVEAAEAAAAEARAEAEQASARADRLRGGVPGRRLTAFVRRLLVATAGLVVGGCVVLTALMVSAHREVAAQRAQEERIVEAARAAVGALLSIDHSRARADVQRVLDLTTGTFRDDFAKAEDDFVSTAESQKVVTVGVLKAAALESAAGDGGVVLVAVNSEVTNAAGAKQDSRPFRMSVTVARDGGQYKMSSLEFVP